MKELSGKYLFLPESVIMNPGALVGKVNGIVIAIRGVIMSPGAPVAR